MRYFRTPSCKYAANASGSPTRSHTSSNFAHADSLPLRRSEITTVLKDKLVLLDEVLVLLPIEVGGPEQHLATGKFVGKCGLHRLLGLLLDLEAGRTTLIGGEVGHQDLVGGRIGSRGRRGLALAWWRNICWRILRRAEAPPAQAPIPAMTRATKAARMNTGAVFISLFGSGFGEQFLHFLDRRHPAADLDLAIDDQRGRDHDAEIGEAHEIGDLLDFAVEASSSLALVVTSIRWLHLAQPASQDVEFLHDWWLCSLGCCSYGEHAVPAAFRPPC